MPEVQLDGARIRVGERFSVSFQRTLRIPEDDQIYPLPPGLGVFQIHRVADFAESVPAAWRRRGGFFIAMYQREALWLGFDGAEWKPNAVKVAVGGVNAISGTVWEEGLDSEVQNYLVCPNQPWLDGINAGEGFIKQFVAAPLGSHATVEAQVTGREEVGGIQLVVYEPKPGKFPDHAPEMAEPEVAVMEAMSLGDEMGMAAGGRIKQKIYVDPYGTETWDQQNFARLHVHILNSEQYRAITGLEPPLTPVSAETYAEYGLPWFDLYDESFQGVAASAKLAAVKTLRQKDEETGKNKARNGRLIDVKQLPVRKLGEAANRKPHLNVEEKKENQNE
jgi:hypothetical protein